LGSRKCSRPPAGLADALSGLTDESQVPACSQPIVERTDAFARALPFFGKLVACVAMELTIRT